MARTGTVRQRRPVSKRAFLLGLVGTVVLVGVVGVGGFLAAGLGSDEPGYPSADFAFDYRVVDEDPNGDDWGVLTVTHRCGDAVPADRLHVIGEGFNETGNRTLVTGLVDEPPDMLDDGPWNGTTGYETTPDGDPVPAVGPGDSVRLYVESSYRIRVGFAPRDAQAFVRLDVDVGPDADAPTATAPRSETATC